MKVSIITTIYKAEKDLPRLLNSMMEQKSQELEFFLIDNGSPDRCGEICQEYAKRDSRFTVCRLEENIGYIRARNYGIEHCDADYIGFCDSDDFLEPGGYDLAIEKIKQYDCDLYITGYRTIINDTCVVHPLPYSVGAYNGIEVEQSILPAAFGPINGKNGLHGFAWKQLFRKQLVIDHACSFLPELQPYEDQIFNIDVIKNCNRVVIDDTIIYNYIVNAESITAKMAINFNAEKEWLLIKNFWQAKYRRATADLHYVALNNQCLMMMYSLLLNMAKSKKNIRSLQKFCLLSFEDSIVDSAVNGSSKFLGAEYRFARFCLAHKTYFLLFLWLRSALRLRNIFK